MSDVKDYFEGGLTTEDLEEKMYCRRVYGPRPVTRHVSKLTVCSCSRMVLETSKKLNRVLHTGHNTSVPLGPDNRDINSP